jgi:hypothetical protein
MLAIDIRHADALDDAVSFEDASVVFLYLLPRGTAAIAAKLEAQLKPGTRVVCHLFRRAFICVDAGCVSSM